MTDNQMLDQLIKDDKLPGCCDDVRSKTTL